MRRAVVRNSMSDQAPMLSRITDDPATWPSFRDIPEPRMVCFGTGNGSGTKLFQGFLDSHPNIYMVPVNQLMYLYPHWDQWREELAGNWCWDAIVERLCINHASLLDSGRIPGHDGMTTLGDNQDQCLTIDEQAFRAFLAHILKDEEITTRTFVLAAHYAYAYARGEDLSVKTVLVYHIHVHEYVRYLKADFPDMHAICFVRDLRAKIKGGYTQNVGIDKIKHNATDAAIYLRRTFMNHWRFHIDSLERFRGMNIDNIRAVRHEDMNLRLRELMEATAKFLEIPFHPCLMENTFGGLKWWGDSLFDMKPMNKPNPRTVKQLWRDTLPALDCFILEGLAYDYFRLYGFKPDLYTKDTLLNRTLLVLALFVPMKYERDILWTYLSPRYFRDFLKAAVGEANGSIELKDYSFNAFFRHKWYNQGLNMHIEPAYRRFVRFARERAAAQGGIYKALSALAQVNYVVCSLGRYLYAVCACPFIFLKRSVRSLEAFRRMIQKTEILPRPMI